MIKITKQKKKTNLKCVDFIIEYYNKTIIISLNTNVTRNKLITKKKVSICYSELAGQKFSHRKSIVDNTKNSLLTAY